MFVFTNITNKGHTIKFSACVKHKRRMALNNNVLKRGMLFTQHPMRSRCCTRTPTTLTTLRFFPRSFIHCQQRCSLRKKGSAGQGGKPTWTSWNEPWLVVPDTTLLVTKANEGDSLCNNITAALKETHPKSDKHTTCCLYLLRPEGYPGRTKRVHFVLWEWKKKHTNKHDSKKNMIRQVAAEEQRASCGWLTNSTNKHQRDLV